MLKIKKSLKKMQKISTETRLKKKKKQKENMEEVDIETLKKIEKTS